ncbi:hypothetical protein MKW92_026458, partial [Papaver armeniacum]
MTSLAGDSKLRAGGSVRSRPSNEVPVDGKLSVKLQVKDIKEPIKAPKIQDFCLGIPF